MVERSVDLGKVARIHGKGAREGLHTGQDVGLGLLGQGAPGMRSSSSHFKLRLCSPRRAVWMFVRPVLVELGGWTFDVKGGDRSIVVHGD